MTFSDLATPPAEPYSQSAEVLDARLAALPERRDCVEVAVHTGQPGLDEAHNAMTRRALLENRSNRSRWRLMMQVADELDRAVEPVAACKKGCSHCCHIKVEMTDLEARQLGEAIGRQPNTRTRYTSLDEAWFSYDTPCPFLDDDECSIYEHRPMACRKNHNLDIDELFCRLDLPVRYREAVLRVRSDALLALYASTFTATTKIGDIRDWFPGERDLQRGPQGLIETAQALLTEVGSC